jgi:hypothetical protein
MTTHFNGFQENEQKTEAGTSGNGYITLYACFFQSIWQIAQHTMLASLQASQT